MSTTIELRQYQEDSVVAIFDYWNQNVGNPLVVLPTGSGKSIVLAEFCRRACTAYPDTKLLVLSHVQEILSQDAAAINQIWPEGEVSIFSAGLGEKDLSGQVVIAGIQSVYARAADVGMIDVVLIDEAHLLTPDATGMYRQFLAGLSAINPDLKVVGFTATPFRMDRGLLYGQEGCLFEAIAHEVKLGWMVEQGYLVPLRSKHTDTTLDVSGVGKRGGEYIPGELEQAVDKEELTRPIVAELVAKGADRGSWLVFASGVEHAHHLAGEIGSHGIHVRVITGDTPKLERREAIAEFKAGKSRCLVTVNVLTTGFDAPGVDLIAFVRPTMSKGLLLQMAGRGMRLAEGKEDSLALDFAGNFAQHGPVDMIDGAKKLPGKGGLAPVRTCPKCQEICYAGCRTCPACGHQFPPPVTKLRGVAGDAPAMSGEVTDRWLPVMNVTYHYHQKQGSRPTLRVEYHCGREATYKQWVCFEHDRFPREEAVRWWVARRPGRPVPRSINEALAQSRSLPQPVAIQVRPDGKYWRVTKFQF